MEVLQGRIDSFFKPRRAKQPSSKASSTISLKWPHGLHFKATPDTLAEAGFFFNPSYDDRDNVTCYMCGKELSDWTEDDDPFDIHWTKCRKECSWAIVRCGLRDDRDRNGRYVFTDKTRIPSSKAMEKARLETFFVGDGWPHDHSKNHGATSKKMAHAGFIYSPQQVGDDLATCLYCNISLSGWDEDDDPMKEHRKRENKSGVPCPFFHNLAPALPAKPAPSKPPSRSTNKHSAKHTDILEPTKIYDGEDSDTTTIPVTATTTSAKTPRKPRATSTAKTPRTLTRSRSKAQLREADTESQDEERNVTPPRMPRKSTRSRSKSKAEADMLEEGDGDMKDDMLAPQTIPKKVSKKASKTSTEVEDGGHAVRAEEDTARKMTRQRSKSRARSVSRSRSKAELAETEEDEADKHPPPARKGSRSKSKSKPDAISGDVHVEIKNSEDTEVLPTVLPASRKARSTTSSLRKASKAKRSIKETDDEDGDDDMLVLASTSSQPTTTVTSKTKAKSIAKSIITGEEKSKDEGEDKKVLAPAPGAKKVPLKSRSKSKSKVAEETDDVEDDEELLLPAVSHKPSKASLRADVDDVGQHPPPSSTTAVPKKLAKSKSKANIVADNDKDNDALLSKPESKSTAARKPRSRSKARGKSNIENTSGVQSEGGSTTGESTADAKRGSRIGRQAEIKEIWVSEDHQKELSGSRSGEVTKNALTSGGNKPEAQPEDDAEMAEVEEEIVGHEQHEVPTTPPRNKAPQVVKEIKTVTSSSGVMSSALSSNSDVLAFQFVPPLSKDPFVNLASLSDVELDMTVEEWIRYQMGVEYERFKSDGERELASFQRRAEEVRRAIEAL